MPLYSIHFAPQKPKKIRRKKCSFEVPKWVKGKAGEGIRTLDIQLGKHKVDFVNDLKSNSYNIPENHFSTDFSKNNGTIQQDLAKIIKRWSLLPPNIKSAIMVLIGGGEDE